MIRTLSRPLVAGALVLGTIAPPAAAQTYPLREAYSRDSHQAVFEARIPYSDVDPASSAGARLMLARIETAADQVCGGAEISRSDYQARAFEECRQMAISGAVARIRSPALTRLAARARREMRADR